MDIDPLTKAQIARAAAEMTNAWGLAQEDPDKLVLMDGKAYILVSAEDVMRLITDVITSIYSTNTVLPLESTELDQDLIEFMRKHGLG